MKRRTQITTLLPGDAIPEGTPRRYLCRTGAVRLRWQTGPYAYVEVREHHIVDGHVVPPAPPARPVNSLTTAKRALRRTVWNANDCLVYQGYLNKQGYGRIAHYRKARNVHRVVYEALIAPVPEELVLDHLCRNRACCNPLHLEPVTNAENIRRGFAARRKAA